MYGYNAVMDILIVGQGPIARVLATSMKAECQVTLAVRTPGDELDTVATQRVGVWPRPVIERIVKRSAVGSVRGRWDLVVTTASPGAPGIREILERVEADAIAAVSQVPSEVATLEKLANDRLWALVAPGVLAWDRQTTKWWRLSSVVSVAGPAAPIVRDVFRARTPEVSIPKPLLQAATMMPVVAGLETVDFQLERASHEIRRWACAANEARAAIAAEYQLAKPRPVLPMAVRSALWVLPHLAPMDVPTYLGHHFGGHRLQTVRMLTDWTDAAQRHGLDSGTLEELIEQLGRREYDR